MTSATQIVGDTSLPPGFQDPHASEEARAIASAGRIRLDAILELDESEVDAMVDEFDRWRHKADPSE